jgi:hypothetical protein
MARYMYAFARFEIMEFPGGSEPTTTDDGKGGPLKAAIFVLAVLVLGSFGDLYGQTVIESWDGVRQGIAEDNYGEALHNMQHLSGLLKGDGVSSKGVAELRKEFFEAFKNKAVVYTATLSLGNVYTNDVVETTKYSFYTFGQRNPMLLKVKAELTNYSGEVLNLLARAPLLQFEQISYEGPRPQAFAYCLVADQYANPKEVSQWMVYPGQTKSGEFTYYQRINESTHDPAEFCNNIFGMLLENDRAGSFSNAYGAGKASMFINLEGQVYPLGNLSKSR